MKLLRTVIFVALALLSGCAARPVPGVWPPAPGSPAVPVVLAVTGLHAIIIYKVEPQPDAATPDAAASPALPNATLSPAASATPAGKPKPPAPVYREWEFAAKAWYLEGRRGWTEAARSLFLFPPSGVGRADHDAPVWERRSDLIYRRWTLLLTPEGFARMTAMLEADRGEPIEGYTGWCESRRHYSVFHNCNHFAADALRAAGLPIRPRTAFTAGSLERQLARAAKTAPGVVVCNDPPAFPDEAGRPRR